MLVYLVWFYWHFTGLLEEHGVQTADEVPFELIFAFVSVFTLAFYMFLVRAIYKGSSRIRSLTSLVVLLLILTAFLDPRPNMWIPCILFGVAIVFLWLPSSNDYYFRGVGRGDA